MERCLDSESRDEVDAMLAAPVGVSSEAATAAARAHLRKVL